MKTKTLDEVIEYFNNQCKMRHVYLTEDADARFAEALHYLKEYKNTDENYKKAIAHVTEVIDHYEKMVADYLAVNNPPLTWDELKQMEGKPVWVEYGIGFNQKRWVVIHSFHNTGSFCYMNVSGNYPDTFWQKDMGEDEFWQAYRKER